jgi:glycosyltransferase involved in cell wall biosynthesis
MSKLPGIQLGPILVREGTPPKLGLEEGDYDFRQTPSRLGARSKTWKHAVRIFDAHVVFAPTEISFARYDIPLILAIRYPGFPRAHIKEYSARERCRFALQKVLARTSARNASAHIAVSQHAADVAINELHVPASRIRVVYHGGPDESQPMKQGPATKFLFVSNLYRYKNVGRLIEAFAGVDEGTLRIVGRVMEPRLQVELDQFMATRPGLESRIQFLGPLSGPELRDAYAWADCFLWPPYAETFGHPLLEAHSVGLPIIASRASSNEEIAGDGAIYVDPFNPRQLRQSIELAVSKGLRTGKLPRTYSWDRCSIETASVLRESALLS